MTMRDAGRVQPIDDVVELRDVGVGVPVTVGVAAVGRARSERLKSVPVDDDAGPARTEAARAHLRDHAGYGRRSDSRLLEAVVNDALAERRGLGGRARQRREQQRQSGDPGGEAGSGAERQSGKPARARGFISLHGW